jgi:YbbR domain-containing protein
VEQDFELPLEVVVPEMLAVAAPFQQRVSITVRSEDEEAISDISSGDFRAYVDLTDFRSEGAYRVPVRYTRTGFALNSAAFVDRVEPAAVEVKLEEKIEKLLPVAAVIVGSPARGYELDSYTVFPSEIRAIGPRSRLETLDRLSTVPIDLSSESGDFSMRTDLEPVDPFLSLAGESWVDFTAKFREIIGQRSFDGVAVTVANPALPLAPANFELSGAITVQGPELIIERLERRDFDLFIDLGSIIEPGEYILPLMVRAPPGVTVLSYGPKESNVVVVFVAEEAE